MNKSLSMGVLALLVGVMCFCESRSTVCGQQPDKKDEKRYTMEFNNAPWKEVMRWYAEKTGMPYASKWPAPAGTFSHVTPKDRTYSQLELTAIINERLMKEGFVLVPRMQTVTLIKIAKD